MAGIALVAAPVIAQASDRVTIHDGTLQGATADGVTSFKGIPLAAPPVGTLRWQPPQPPASWPGAREATGYGHDCMQKPVASDAAPLGTPPAEDCLYLNLWQPRRAAAGAKLPVLVWIYGGGFVNGGSSPPTYSGAELARRGIAFAASQGIAETDPDALAKLRALSAEQVTGNLNMSTLLGPSKGTGAPTYTLPVIDGRLAVDAPAAYRAGNFHHVPVIAGATSADLFGPGGPMMKGARDVVDLLSSKGVPVHYYRSEPRHRRRREDREGEATGRPC